MRQSVITFLSICFLATLLSACVAQPTKQSPELQALIHSANTGGAEAQFKLGSSYDFGQGVSRDGKEALKWYLMAANAGHAEAQNSVGSGYQAEKKYQLAYEWYEKAAKQNHALATNNLAYLHDLGLGVPQDRQKGYELYLRSAKLGWPDAMFNIGQMLGSGQLGEPNLKEACVWTIRALKYSTPGSEQELAKKTVNFCKQKLSVTAFESAGQAANQWSPTPINNEKP